MQSNAKKITKKKKYHANEYFTFIFYFSFIYLYSILYYISGFQPFLIHGVSDVENKLTAPLRITKVKTNNIWWQVPLRIKFSTRVQKLNIHNYFYYYHRKNKCLKMSVIKYLRQYIAILFLVSTAPMGTAMHNLKTTGLYDKMFFFFFMNYTKYIKIHNNKYILVFVNKTWAASGPPLLYTTNFCAYVIVHTIRVNNKGS